MPPKIVSAPKALGPLVADRGDLLDVSPHTRDPLGQALLPTFGAGLHEALWKRYEEGYPSRLELAALEELCRRHLRAGPNRLPSTSLVVEALSRLSKKVILTCACVGHGSGDCLRSLLGRALAESLPGSSYGGDLRLVRGRPLASRIASPLETLSPLELAGMLALLEGPGLADKARSAWERFSVWRREASSQVPTGLPLPSFALTLGLSSWPCPREEIEGARRRLILQHHPDRPGGSALAMVKVQEAYDAALGALPGTR